MKAVAGKRFLLYNILNKVIKISHVIEIGTPIEYMR